MALSPAVEDELSCPICCELFIDKRIPKVLDCRHDVCQICLQSLTEDRTVKCPQCRLITTLESGGIAELKPNYRVRNLAEIYSRCNSKDETFCTIHTDQKSLFVCISCNVPTCQYCILHNHTSGNHINKGRKEVLKERKEQSKLLLNEAEERIQKCKRKLDLLTEFGKKAARKADSCRNEQSAHVKALVEDIQQKRTEIVCQLQHKEQERLRSIEQRLNYCLQCAEKLEYASGSVGDLNDQQYSDWFRMTTGKLDLVISNEKLFPDTSKPFTVSVVELGTHPHCIDIRSLTTTSDKTPKTLDFPNTGKTFSTSVEELRCSHSSHIFDNRQYDFSKAESASNCHMFYENTKTSTQSLEDVSEELRRCKNAADAWRELHGKVSASLHKEESRISTHAQMVINEITQQGTCFINKLQIEADGYSQDVQRKSDCCQKQIKDLETTCNTLSKMSDDEFISNYEDLAKSTSDTMSKEVSCPETENLNFESEFALYQYRQHLYVGNVLHNSKYIYLRKQLIAQIDCTAAIQSIDSSDNGYLVIASTGESQCSSSIATVWSNTYGEYQQILSLKRDDNLNPNIASSIAVNVSSDYGFQYLVARTTELESYSAFGSYESTLLTNYNIDESNAMRIHSVATNSNGLIVIGDCTRRTLTFLSSDGIRQVIQLPFHPYKITFCGTNVVYTDVKANRVHCINYISCEEVFSTSVPGPTGVCFNESTNSLYICRNEGSPGCSSIALYSGTSCELLEDRVVTGLDSPQDCCLLPGKELVVADGNHVKIYCME